MKKEFYVRGIGVTLTLKKLKTKKKFDIECWIPNNLKWTPSQCENFTNKCAIYLALEGFLDLK